MRNPGLSADKYRDVDVRLMLERSGLPVDFQIERSDVANERYGSKARSPLGMGRIFAGGGDGTPVWDGTDRAKQTYA